MGYAGRDLDASGVFVAGKNNPAKKGAQNVGPLPCGFYAADWIELADAEVGKFAIHLKPDATTEAKILAYGRQPFSFFIHGDSLEHPGAGSDGCIVQDLNVRQQFWNCGDRSIQVVSGPTATYDIAEAISNLHDELLHSG
ncbi:MAG: hypothetical protein WA718_23755 [Terriglobales bacterium]